MKEDNFNIHIFSVFMEKIFEKVWNRLIGDVTTYNNVPKKYFWLKNYFFKLEIWILQKGSSDHLLNETLLTLSCWFNTIITSMQQGRGKDNIEDDETKIRDRLNLIDITWITSLLSNYSSSQICNLQTKHFIFLLIFLCFKNKNLFLSFVSLCWIYVCS